MSPPSGLLALYGPGVPVTAAQISLPWVSGVSLRLRWCDLQSNPWQVDTSYLDQQLAVIRQVGKPWNFSVQSGQAAPSWLVQEGAQCTPFLDHAGNRQLMPLPWDPVALSMWTWLVGRMGNRYSGDRLLSHVKTGGPLSSTTEEDMLLPGGPKGGSQLTSQFWTSQGLGWPKIFGAEMLSVDAWHTAFPLQYLVHQGVASGLPACDGVGEEAITERMIAYYVQRYPFSAVIQNNGLSAFWSWQFMPSVTAHTTGFQTLWSILNDPGWRMNGGMPGDPLDICKAAVNRGIAAGASYLEIYHADLVSPVLAPVWQQLHGNWGPVT